MCAALKGLNDDSTIFCRYFGSEELIKIGEAIDLDLHGSS